MSTDRISDYLQQFAQARAQMTEQLGRVVIGQAEVIEQILAAVFTRGHCLLVGVPGLAKTLMVSSIAQILDVSFKRVQFTPDLMPSDITGTMVLDENDQGRREFRFIKGPIFANILLADEINRTPPKTQAALLQAMQEREVTVGQENVRKDWSLDEPELAASRLVLVEHGRAGDVGRHQVRRELDALEADVENLADRANHERLRQPRHADEQAMPAREDSRQDLFDDLVLPDDGPPQLLDDLRARLAELSEIFTDAVG